MAEEVAQEGRAGAERPAASHPIIARERAEVPIDNKWPIAWRLLFLFGAAAILWILLILIVRWS